MTMTKIPSVASKQALFKGTHMMTISKYVDLYPFGPYIHIYMAAHKLQKDGW